jgi:hypothetical protein
VNAVRRVWRVYADPASSTAAYALRALIAFWGAAVLLRVTLAGLAGVDASILPPLHRLIDMGWAYAVLWFVRQRDEAQAGLQARDRV